MKFDPAMSKNEHVKLAKDGLDVWTDIHRYATEGFSKITEDDFARMRWFGIYQQKPNVGNFMWRIKLPGGRVTAKQLRIIGELSRDFGRDIADITTRQDIQLHWLTIESFPPCFERIYKEAGLYTDFACGDTPRNTCSCPLHGILKNEIVDLGDMPQQIADMFRAAGKEFSNLPRKFKTTIAACPLHCHQPQINDLSAFGVISKDGRRGLGIMVGGGLSSTPHFAQSLRIFIPQEKIAEQIPAIFRGVAGIFRDADELRYKRIRARLKFLVADKGWQWMRDELQKRVPFQLEQDETIVQPRGGLHTDHMGIGEQKDGLFYVGIPVARGRTSGTKLIALASVIEEFCADGKAEVRLSQKQNILITNVPKENIDALKKALDEIGLPATPSQWRQSIVSCTGTEFCNLAVAETKERAKEVLEYLEKEVALDVPIMVSISGCPNSCAQYQVAEIGLTGIPVVIDDQIRRAPGFVQPPPDENGKPHNKIDGFNLLIGGCLGDHPEFGEELFKKVPAFLVKRVIAQLVRNYMTNRTEYTDGEVEAFRDFVSRSSIEQLRQWAMIPEWTPPAPKAPRPAVAATAAALA